MNWFKRLKYGGVSSLEAELFANRPEPPKRLTDAVVSLVSPQPVRARRSSLRFAPAVALTAALVGLLGATGGFAYAAQTAAHLTHSAAAPKAGVSSACSQYAKAPKVSNISPTKGKPKVTVTIKGLNFSGPSKITDVTFGGGKSATFKVKNSTTLTTRVPKGAKTGGITVTNCAGSATSKKFTVKK
jgi:hypothetical protein